MAIIFLLGKAEKNSWDWDAWSWKCWDKPGNEISKSEGKVCEHSKELKLWPNPKRIKRD